MQNVAQIYSYTDVVVVVVVVVRQVAGCLSCRDKVHLQLTHVHMLPSFLLQLKPQCHTHCVCVYFLTILACHAHDLMLTIALPDAGASWNGSQAMTGSMAAFSVSSTRCCCCRIVVVVAVVAVDVPGNAYTQIDSLLIKKPSKMALARSSALQLQRFAKKSQVQVRPCHWQLCNTSGGE